MIQVEPILASHLALAASIDTGLSDVDSLTFFIRVSYKDDEGDVVMLHSDSDVIDAVGLARMLEWSRLVLSAELFVDNGKVRRPWSQLEHKSPPASTFFVHADNGYDDDNFSNESDEILSSKHLQSDSPPTTSPRSHHVTDLLKHVRVSGEVGVAVGAFGLVVGMGVMLLLYILKK